MILSIVACCKMKEGDRHGDSSQKADHARC